MDADGSAKSYLHQSLLLEYQASMHAALLRYNPPHDFAAEYLLERLFKFMPLSLAMPVAPTRVALAAKQSLFRAIQYLVPVDDSPEGSLDRLVIEYGAFGIRNTTIAIQAGSCEPLATSLFDWETTFIWPALLSNPLVAAGPMTWFWTKVVDLRSRGSQQRRRKLILKHRHHIQVLAIPPSPTFP